MCDGMRRWKVEAISSIVVWWVIQTIEGKEEKREGYGGREEGRKEGKKIRLENRTT